MNKERLKEIKDSVNFQREILKAHNMETLCIDEEQELIEEIERLNKRNKEIYEGFMATTKELTEYAEEIERLNNIINELEKWLEEQHQFIIEIPAFTKEIAVEHKTMELCYESVLDKLQELKGSEKE